jgi:hypothetical protein
VVTSRATGGVAKLLLLRLLCAFLTSAMDGGEWVTFRFQPLYSREIPLCARGIGADWAPEPVWTLWGVVPRLADPYKHSNRTDCTVVFSFGCKRTKAQEFCKLLCRLHNICR